MPLFASASSSGALLSRSPDAQAPPCTSISAGNGPSPLRPIQARQQRRVAVAQEFDVARLDLETRRDRYFRHTACSCVGCRENAAPAPRFQAPRRPAREGGRHPAFAGRVWVCPIREVIDASPNFRRARRSARPARWPAAPTRRPGCSPRRRIRSPCAGIPANRYGPGRGARPRPTRIARWPGRRAVLVATQ